MPPIDDTKDPARDSVCAPATRANSAMAGVLQSGEVAALVDVEVLRDWLDSQTFDADEHTRMNRDYVVGWNHAIRHISACLTIDLSARDAAAMQRSPQDASRADAISAVERGLAELRDAEVTTPRPLCERFDIGGEG